MNLGSLANQISFTLPAWFNELGIIAVFLTSAIPFFPVPPEPIALGTLALDSSPSAILNISVVIAVGAIISHIMVYYAGTHLHKIHHKIKKHKNLTEQHIFHKYGVWLFLVIPTISIVIPPLPDALMGYLGHKRANPMKLFSAVFAGEIIRIPMTYLIITELVKLL